MIFETEIRSKITSDERKVMLKSVKWSEPFHVSDITFGKHGYKSMDIDGWVLRIRKIKNKTTLEYKGRCSDLKETWKEISLEIDSVHKAVNLLISIGLSEGLLIEKERRVATIGDINICLDDVLELGSYIEAEYVSLEKKSVDINILKDTLYSIGLLNLCMSEAYGDQLIDKIENNISFSEYYFDKIKKYVSLS